jgi:hypothetical protein
MSAPRPRPRRQTRRPARFPSLERLEERSLLALIIAVNTTADHDPTGATMTLREAIQLSNDPSLYSSLTAAEKAQVVVSISPPPTGSAPPVPNTIVFDIPLADVIPGTKFHQISTASALPPITAPVIMSGYSQPDSAISGPTFTEEDINSPTVRIDGSSLPASNTPVDGLAVQAPDCEISGLIVTGFSGSGASISGDGSQGNWFWGDFFGCLPDPTHGQIFAADPAAHLGNAAAGVTITASNNMVGGNTPGLPCVMANNGYDQSGNNVGGAGLVITGASATGNLIEGNGVFVNAAQGILVESSNNTIGEDISGGGNSIGGNGAQGIEVAGGPNVQGNGILGNFVGTAFGDATVPTTQKGEIRYPNQAQGIWVNDSPKNRIGGVDKFDRNVVGENLLDGIYISGPDAVGNRIQNNYIGFNILDSGLEAFLPNQNGVTISAPGNFVGDPLGSGNTIDNNRNYGIQLIGAGASGNTVAGNVIGLNPGGGSAFRNAFDGIHIDNAPHNLIGGTTSAARNTISSNNNGVYITGVGATGNTVEGNFIGTATDGVTDLGNAVDGVVLDNAPLNTVGGTAAGAGNVISGNNNGVRISGPAAMNNQVLGNFIGTDLTATRFTPNEVDGVIVTLGASNNLIGGLSTGSGNTIYFNIGAGVDLNDGTGNSVLGNGIYDNTGGGIIQNVPNHADRLQPAPTLQAIAPGGSTTNVQGSLVAAPGTTFTVQLFSSPTKDPSGFGQGMTVIDTVTVTTNAYGWAAINVDVPQAVPSGQWVTATATDPLGNSSEFSNAVISVPVQFALGSSTYTASESAGAVAITVTRGGGQGGAAAVNYAVTGLTAVAGTDFTAVSGTLFFNPGDPATKTFTIPILDPHKVGGSVTANIALSQPTNGATLGTPSTAVLTILDNDVTSLNVIPAGNPPGVFVGSGAAVFTVVRDSPLGTTTVNYFTSSGTAVAGVNYLPAYGSLTFAPGVTSLTVPVTILNDNQPHAGPLSFFFNLSGATNGLLGPNGSVGQLVVPLSVPGVFLFSSGAFATAAGASAESVTVYRAVGATGTATVNYACAGGTAQPGVNYWPVSGTLTFGPGVTSEVITIPLLNTSTPGRNTSFALSLSNPADGATLGRIATAIITIVQGPGGNTNDHTPPTITDTQPVAGPQGVYAIAVQFSEAMDAARASNVNNFGHFVRTAGPDGVFGTLDDQVTGIARAVYDPSAFRTVLLLATPIPLNEFALVDFSGNANAATGLGLADTSGNLLDGTGTGGNPGSPYIAYLAEGTSFTYVDNFGNLVSLQLSGPGLMTLRRGLSGGAQELAFFGASPGQTALSGQVTRSPYSAGITAIPVIAGASGVNLRLTYPPFYVGMIVPSTAAMQAKPGRA